MQTKWKFNFLLYHMLYKRDGSKVNMAKGTFLLKTFFETGSLQEIRNQLKKKISRTTNFDLRYHLVVW